MTVWRPSSKIQVKVLGLVWRGAQLLVAEVEDDGGRVKGVRPLGGTIELGETREAALGREFHEELGCAATVTGPWHAFENLFEHEGLVGHEYIFAANASLADQRLYQSESIAFAEADLVPCRAVWRDPAALPQGIELYPAGLAALIRSASSRPQSRPEPRARTDTSRLRPAAVRRAAASPPSSRRTIRRRRTGSAARPAHNGSSARSAAGR